MKKKWRWRISNAAGFFLEKKKGGKEKKQKHRDAKGDALRGRGGVLFDKHVSWVIGAKNSV